MRQGCVLSPCLFNLYTETIFRHIEDSKGETIEGTQINNLRGMQMILFCWPIVKEICRTWWTRCMKWADYTTWKMNAKKTKVMVISRNENKPKVNIKVDGTAVVQVGIFNYLRQTVSDDGRCVHEIKKRIETAKTTFSKMKDVLKSTKIPLHTRKRILQWYVWSTLLYETWTITKVMKTRIEAFELLAYRRLLKISRTEKVTNKEVLSRMKRKKRLFTILQIRKLKYFGY